MKSIPERGCVVHTNLDIYVLLLRYTYVLFTICESVPKYNIIIINIKYCATTFEQLLDYLPLVMIYSYIYVCVYVHRIQVDD